MPFAFPILVDPSYNDAYIYIPILTISIYYTNMSNFYGGIFTAYKDTKIMGSTTFAAAIINIPAAIKYVMPITSLTTFDVVNNANAMPFIAIKSIVNCAK